MKGATLGSFSSRGEGGNQSMSNAEKSVLLSRHAYNEDALAQHEAMSIGTDYGATFNKGVLTGEFPATTEDGEPSLVPYYREMSRAVQAQLPESGRIGENFFATLRKAQRRITTTLSTVEEKFALGVNKAVSSLYW